MESQCDQAAEMIELAQHLSSSDGKNKSHLDLVINDCNFQHVISSDIENDENQACQNFGVIEDTASELEQTIDGFIATISSQSLERFKEEEIQNESTQYKTPIKRRKTRLSSPSIGCLNDVLNKFRDSLFRKFQNVSVSANGRVREDSTNKSIIRSIKKFPKVLLSLFATKAQLRNMNKIYEHIERCFNNGFLYLVGNEAKIFEIEEDLLLSDFISLCFPPTKAIQILKSVTGEALDKQHFVAQSRNSSIRGNKKNSDLTIKLICSKILSLNDTNEIV